MKTAFLAFTYVVTSLILMFGAYVFIVLSWCVFGEDPNPNF